MADGAYRLPASRLIGYQMLPWERTPYNIARSAIATAPASPPFTPAESGWAFSGSHARGTPDAARNRITGRGGTISAFGGATTATSSWRSWGNTSRNHPTAPITYSTAPSTLTAAPTRSPEQMSATPTASTNGHAVGAGITTTAPSGCSMSSSAGVSGRSRTPLEEPL